MPDSPVKQSPVKQFPAKQWHPEETPQASAGTTPVELEFAEKYDRTHAWQYLEKHQDSLARKLSHWRDCQLAKSALQLAGEPRVVLDLPCGAGRFWPLLADKPDRVLYAADNSPDMIQVAIASQPARITRDINIFQTSAFAIDLPDCSVDSIFCMRLIHHIADREHRLALLREFHRVTRDSLILSLWVDGNYKAWKRKRLEQRRSRTEGEQSNKNRFVLNQRQAEMEFDESGFIIQGYRDFLPGYAMWRVYVLNKKDKQ